MADTLETVNGSIVQHGHYNDRIYLMRLNPGDIKGTLTALDALATGKGYGKVLARIPLWAWPDFKTAGYRKEAVIPGFYQGRTDGLFVARYYSVRRQVAPDSETVAALLSNGDNQTPGGKPGAQPVPPPIVACRPKDTADMSALFKAVFESYPFPIHDPDYLRQALAKGVLYYCVRAGGGITALAAAEIDRESEVVEMTDFATLPEWRKTGLAEALLRHMENETRKRGIKTAYTIARASSRGISRLFKSNAYRYAGLLVNNTQISGSIQSMAVWYKPL